MTVSESFDGELWRPVVGMNGTFLVSDMGRVYSVGRRCVMRGDRTSPYPRVMMRAQGLYRRECVHVLVLESFVGPSNGLWGLHRNDIKSDNRPANLYWGTPKQNSDDRVRLGNSGRGDKNPRSRMSDEVAEWVRESEQSSIVVASVLDVSSSTVRAVRLGVNRNRDGRSLKQIRNYLGTREQRRALETKYAEQTRKHFGRTE